jgi:tetratricopeptide (TPR) repeat protein
MMEMERNRGALASARLNGDSDTILAEISFFLLTSQSASAGSFTYQKDFKRRNGLPVSRETYRNKAIAAVEGLILNELVASLGNEPAVTYFELSGEEIQTLAKAILQRNVMEEKWDGQCYYLRARLIGDCANSEAYPEILRQIQGKTRALLDARERAREALEEVKKLEGELEGTQASARVLEAITVGDSAPGEAAASWIREGDKLWERGDYARALSAYETAMAHDPASGGAFLGRGAAYFRMNEYAKAVQDFERACELSPLDVTAHINLGSGLAKTGSHAQALEVLNQALALDSRSLEARLNRGILYLVHRSDLDSALVDFTEAIRLRPDDYRGYLNRGAVYAKMGRYDEAVDDYDRSLAQNPGFTITYFNRANAEMRLGGAEQAIEGYTRFVERLGDHAGGYFNRALAYAETGDYGSALPDFDRAVSLDPGQARPLLCRGILHYKTASMHRARDDWEEASKLGDQTAKRYLNEMLDSVHP